VTLGGLTITAKDIEIRDMTTSGWTAKNPANGVTFRNITVRGGIFVTSASNISIIGGSVGPGDGYDSQIKASDTNGAPVPTNILIDGVDFHDWTRNSDPSAHIECLQFGAGVNVTIRNSKFRNCATQGLFLRSWGGTANIGNVLIENNWFDRTNEGYYSLNISEMDGKTYDNIVVRYNSSLQPLLVDGAGTRNVSFVGNIAPRSSQQCISGQRFSRNVWSGASCSSSDKNASPGFVNEGAFDLHLRADSPAINAGDAADFPARDIDGDVRGGTPDAGADER
jgi:hypothetical protein